MVEKKIDKLNKEGQEVRAKIFEPLFALLTSMHIRPNHITGIRLISLPIYLLFIVDRPDIAVTAILIGIILDWFDGGLARYQKNASDRGKFWDVLVDHLLYVFGILGIVLLETMPPVLLAYQLLIAPVLFLLATVHASEKMKTDWIIHPYYRIVYLKPFGIAALILYAYFDIDYFQEIVFLLNIVMTFLTVYYTWALSKRWKTE